VPNGDDEIPFCRAAVRREGREIPIIASSIPISRALAGAEVLT
jgi:pyruvate/2-oxoglutarate/acetoin dehydrogenase E1 component